MSSPKKIGKYTVLQALGSGASASVYLGKDPIGTTVAIKRIEKPSLRQLLSNNEARMMKLYTRHPHLVYLIDKIESFPTLNLVMNYVGPDNMLTYVNREGPFAESFAKQVFEKMISAIDHLHQSGVVHRDLKAENILLTNDVSPVICDLGFAAQWSTKKNLNKSCGSLHYAAPEIIAGKSYTGPEIDVWSLGVVLYTIIAGHLPWSGNREELIDFISHGDYWLIDKFSPQLLELLDHMIEPSPVHRWGVGDIKQCVWYKGDEEVSSDRPSYKSFNLLPPGNQNLFASGRRSGRSLYSSDRSSATSTIEHSPTFDAPDGEENENVPEIVVKCGDNVVDHESNPPPENRVLLRSVSSSNFSSSTNSELEPPIDLSSVPNWSVDISELGKYGEEEIVAPNQPLESNKNVPSKNWKSKLAIFKSFKSNKVKSSNSSRQTVPDKIPLYKTGKKVSSPELLTVNPNSSTSSKNQRTKLVVSTPERTDL